MLVGMPHHQNTPRLHHMRRLGTTLQHTRPSLLKAPEHVYTYTREMVSSLLFSVFSVSLSTLTFATLRVIAPRNHHPVLAHARDLVGPLRGNPTDDSCWIRSAAAGENRERTERGNDNDADRKYLRG